MSKKEDEVVFNLQLNEQCIPLILLEFINKYKIDLKKKSFPMENLRDLFKRNRYIFNKIVTILSLYGCDFPINSNPIFPTKLNNVSNYLFSNKDGHFQIEELNKLNMWEMYRTYEFKDIKTINGVFLERLKLIDSDNKIKNGLLKYGFEERKYYKFNQIDKIDNSKGISRIRLPRLYIKFVCSFFSYNTEIISIYKNLGYKKFSDLLKINSNNFKEIIDDLSNKIENVVISSRCIVDLINYVKEKDECERDLQKKSYKFKDLFDSDINNDEIVKYLLINSSIKNEPELFKDFNVSNFVSDNLINYFGKFNINNFKEINFDSLFESQIDKFSIDNSIFDSTSFRPFDILNGLFNKSLTQKEIDLFDKQFYILKYSKIVDLYNKGVFEFMKSKSFSMQKCFEFVKSKESGDTLEEIGEKNNITRERVRQILKEFVRRFSRKTKYIMDQLFELCDFVSTDELRKMPGLLFCIKEDESSNYEYDKELGLVCSKYNCAKIRKFIENVSKSYELKTELDTNFEINKSSINLCSYFFKFSKSIKYTPYPLFTTQKTKNTIDHARVFMEKMGINGFNVNLDVDKAKKYFMQFEGGEDLNYRAIIGRILRLDVVLRDRSTYMLSSFITDEQKSIAKKVLLKATVDSNAGILSKDLFNANAEKLIACGIDNPSFLYGIISKFVNGYSFGGVSMRIFKGEVRHMKKIVNYYMYKNGPIVKWADLQRDIFIQGSSLQNVKIISKFDEDTCILKTFFTIKENELNALKTFIKNEISTKGYCLSRTILDSELAFSNKLNDCFQRNLIKDSPTRLTYFLEHVFYKNGIKQYYFSHFIDCISLNTNIIKSYSDLITQNFKSTDFTINEMNKFLKNNNIQIGSSTLTGILGKLIRCGEDRFIAAKDFEVDINEIKRIEDFLNIRFKNDISVLGNEIIGALYVGKVEHSFKLNPIGLVSALSQFSKNWARPSYDITQKNKQLPLVLANKSQFNGDVPKMSDLIRKEVFSIRNGYISYDEANKYLQDIGLVDPALNYESFKKIFNNYLEDGLIKNYENK